MSVKSFQENIVSNKIPSGMGVILIERGAVLFKFLGETFTRGYLHEAGYDHQNPNFCSGQFRKAVFLRLELDSNKSLIKLIDSSDNEVLCKANVAELFEVLSTPLIKVK